MCGDHSAIDLVSRMAGSAGENVEVRSGRMFTLNLHVYSLVSLMYIYY